MGHVPPRPPPRSVRQQSEEKLRATIDLFRFDRREHNRRLAHAARDELIRRAEIECGLVAEAPPKRWPPKPSDARQSVTRPVMDYQAW